MNDYGKSDRPIVPRKVPNNEVREPSAEGMEGRGRTKGNTPQVPRLRTQRRERLQEDLMRVRSVAKTDRTARFNSIWHMAYDPERLLAAFLAVKRQSAPGIDGQTKQAYEARLAENLLDLSARLARGSYHASPVKRVYIPKPDGRERPIGIPTMEDKIAQRSVAEVLNAVYEVDFHDFSYGFRPGRSQHNALDALCVGLNGRPLNWVLDADIRGFFDNMDHEWLMKFIEHRIADQRVLRHIRKWLRAGVLEDGEVRYAEYGSPQGGSISPLLANIYLHYAFDNWAKAWQTKQATGQMQIVRFADDIVVAFEHHADAERFLAGMQARLSRFHLELNMEKTRLIRFGRQAWLDRRNGGGDPPETFDFLGFTHYCGNTRIGGFAVKRQTSRKKMQTKLRALRVELRKRLHDPVQQVGRWLGSVLEGHYQYYAVPFNYAKIAAFRHFVLCSWKRVLARRSQKAKDTWQYANYLEARYLPRPRILHPYPWKRVRVTDLR